MFDSYLDDTGAVDGTSALVDDSVFSSSVPISPERDRESLARDADVCISLCSVCMSKIMPAHMFVSFGPRGPQLKKERKY